jgi:high affinity sulfate transporter 1
MKYAKNVARLFNLSLLQGLLPLNPMQIPMEIVAGLSFAAIAIPQGMGYTKIAGMPVITGVYTLLLPMVAFAIFGSSRHLVVGADSATAAIIASGLATMALTNSSEYVAYASTIALIAAILLLLAGFLKLGFLADFLSHTALIGFLTGVGIQIAISQISGMLGLPSGHFGTLTSIVLLVKNIHYLSVPTLIVSVGVLLLVVPFRLKHSKIPCMLIAIIAAIAASWLWNFSSYGIVTLGELPAGLPTLSIPTIPLSDIPSIVSIAVACFMVILAQSIVTSRAYSIKFADTFDENKELIGLGLANIAAGITGTFVVNGSPTKTEEVRRAGGRTQFTQLVAVAVTVAFLFFFTKPFAFLPTAVLSSIVFFIGLNLIDIHGMLDLYKHRRVEFVVAVATAIAVVLFGVEVGIVTAIMLSIIAHLRHSYKPLNLLIVPKNECCMKTAPLSTNQHAIDGLLIYRFGANLYFANEGHFEEEILDLAKRSYPIRWFCISATNIGDIDYTSIETMKVIYNQLKMRKITLVMCEVVPPVMDELIKDGLIDIIGKEHVFETVYDVMEAYKNTNFSDVKVRDQADIQCSSKKPHTTAQRSDMEQSA